MSKQSIKTTIDANIKQNGVQAITGQIMNSVLNQMVDNLAEEASTTEKLTELELKIGGVYSYTPNKVVLPNGSIADSSNGAVTAPIPVSGSRARWEFVEKATATDGTNGVIVELNSSFQVVDYWLPGGSGVTNFNIGANTKYLVATMSLAHIKECNILVDGVSVWSAITPNELVSNVRSINKTYELSVLDGYADGQGNLKIDDVSKKVIIDSLGLRIKYNGGTFTIKGDEYQMSYGPTSAPNGGWVLSRSAVENVANGGNITPSSTTIFYADVNSQDFKDNILLFASYYGYLIPCGLLSSLILKRQMEIVSDLDTPMKQYAFNSVYNEVDITTKCKQFSALMNNSGDVESFIFMTDPHLMGTFNTFDAKVFKDYISIMQKYYNMLPIDLMICGGDWLNSNDYQEGACWKLGYVDATMRKLFKHYYPILGNHDTNYHGVVSETDSSRGDLSHDTMRNLMFRENGNTYYTFKGNQTRFFVFDTGTDWEDAMTSYRYEQLQWFANSLLSNTDEHIVILQHIYYQGDTSELFPMSAIEQSIIGAFNNRSSIVVNGQTYNFANARGKIYCIIAGHSHKDSVNNTSSVPVILTTNMMSGNTPTFDMCLIDYTSNKLKMVRVGTGNDRTINL